MINDIWANLAVKDIAKSRDFFTKLGFTFDTQYGNGDDMAGLVIGAKRNIVMLFTEKSLAGFLGTKLTDTKQSNEVMFSLGAESRQNVDDIAKKATDAGGIVFSKPAEIQGWMYGCAFTDLDGHRWNALYMDMSKMK